MSAIRHSVPAAPVLVGVDGSTTSLGAVDLAAREAALRRRPLRIVHAFIWPLLGVPLGPSQFGPPEGGLLHDAERIVDQAVARAREAAPDTVVTGELITGAAVPVLLRCLRTSALAVIGDRGLGGFSGLLVGSVGVQLTAHADRPILIARGRPDPSRPILLGVDGSPANDPAVGYAFEAAAIHQVPLVALHAWKHRDWGGPSDMLPVVHEPAEVEAAESRLLAEALAGWQTKYPDASVQRRLVRDHPRKALIEASSQAQVVVVGSRGRGGFTGLLLGSVSQALLHHAACPVTVVPHLQLRA